MPKEIKQLKNFLHLVKEKNAKGSKAKKTVFIKKNKDKVTKFKVRKGRHLFTFKTNQPDQAKKLQSSLDAKDVEKVEIKKRVVTKKAKK